MKNILLIFSFQILTVIAQLFLYRIYDAHLSPEVMGFLLTILTVSSWLSIADLGTASSLRNKITTLISSNKFAQARVYIASAYVYYLRILLLGLFITIFLLIMQLFCYIVMEVMVRT